MGLHWQWVIIHSGDINLVCLALVSVNRNDHCGVVLFDCFPPLVPVDIMTHVAWRQSGLPPTHVIGAGCNLDSERLGYILKINLNTHKPAWVIGELSDNKCEPERLYFHPVSIRSFLRTLCPKPTFSVVLRRHICPLWFLSVICFCFAVPVMSNTGLNAGVPTELAAGSNVTKPLLDR